MSDQTTTDTPIREAKSGQWFYLFANYIYVHFLSNGQLAWEYLRRNSQYWDDWKLTENFHNTIKAFDKALIASDLPIEMVKTEYEKWLDLEKKSIARLPLKWHLLQLEDPAQRADESPFQWSPGIDVLSVEYTVEENAKWRGEKRSVTDLDANFSVFLDQDGHHLTIHHKGQTIRLHGKQSPFLIGNEVLRLTDDNAKTVTQNQNAKHRANRIFRNAPHLTDTQKLFKNRERHIRNLIAIDGLEVNATHRELAVSMFGEMQVEKHWGDQDNHLKQTVKRSVKNGKKYVEGDYLKLLQATVL